MAARTKSLVPKVLPILLALLLLGIWMVPYPAVRAASSGAGPAQETQAITDFLSSLERAGGPMAFDHNADGRADMQVYPLRTRTPDDQTSYVTLSQAMQTGQFVLREDPRNYNANYFNSPLVQNLQQRYGPNVVAQYTGSSNVFAQRGTGIQGGGQNRSFGSSGVYGRSSGSYGRSSRGTGSRGSRTGSYGTGGTRGSYGTGGYRGAYLSGGRSDMVAAAEPADMELQLWCFEKNRIIPQAIQSGNSDLFNFAGLASPSVRRKLVTASSQKQVDRIVARELQRLGVQSRTLALHDIFTEPSIYDTMRFYAQQSQEILASCPDSTGMMVLDGSGRILCLDVYANVDLFRQMLPSLLQSAALDVYAAAPAEPVASDSLAAEFLIRVQTLNDWEKVSRQAYQHVSNTLVGEMVLLGDAGQTRMVHLEIYPAN
ncbi:MAG: hypothetical protein JW810_08595 [Sedimentisphaerales bacterium]|nr:hypothetical protein [Sedimentisphaerales bacterium]